MNEEIKKLIESVKVYQHPVPLCFDSIARALVEKSDFDKVVKELEYLSELRKPSEDIKQTIEDAAAKYAGISDDKFANSAKTYDAYNIDESFKNGAEFALRLSENSGQVDEDLVKKITDILLKNHHGVGFTIPDFEVTAFEISALIPSSLSQENGDELLEALKETDKDLCVLESTMLQIEQRDHLAEGMTELVKKWRARNKQAISNYEKQSK